MIIVDFVFAFLVSLAIAGVLAAFIVGPDLRRTGGWPAFFFLFVLLLLATWSGGIWIAPFGPVLWNGHWLTFLVVGLIVALLIAAMASPGRPTRGGERIKSGVTEKEAIVLTFGAFFWAALAVLAISIIAHYI